MPSSLPENRGVGDHFGFYEREGRFYAELAESLAARAPHCYYNHIDLEANEFALVLEDFGHRTMVSQIAGIDRERATEAVQALAQVHAQWWESPQLDSLTWMPRAIDVKVTQAGEGYRQAWPRFVELFGDRLPDGAIELGAQVGPTWETTQTAMYEQGPKTIVHGDFRADNLMFDDEAEGREHVGILDWQISMRGGGIGDICYLLTQSMDLDDRRTHERTIVDAWYEALCTALGHAPDGYSVEQAWTDYRTATGNMTVYAVIGGGSMDPSNERGLELVTDMAVRSFSAALDSRGCQPDPRLTPRLRTRSHAHPACAAADRLTNCQRDRDRRTLPGVGAPATRPTSFVLNGTPVTVRRRHEHLLAAAARGARRHLAQGRLLTVGPVRLLHRAGRRQGDRVVPAAARQGGGQGRHHPGGRRRDRAAGVRRCVRGMWWAAVRPSASRAS